MEQMNNIQTQLKQVQQNNEDTQAPQPSTSTGGTTRTKTTSVSQDPNNTGNVDTTTTNTNQQPDSDTITSDDDFQESDSAKTMATNNNRHKQDQNHNMTRKRQTKKRSKTTPEEDDFSTSSDQDDDYTFQHDILPRKRRRFEAKGEHGYHSSSESDDDFHHYDKPITSFGSIIGDGLQQKLRIKILSDRFIEMATLLPQYRTHDPEEYIMKPGRNSMATFVRNKPNPNINISKWNEAFDIYIAVYIENAHSHSDMLKLTRSLLTYKKEINNMAKLGYDWAGYDRHFRSDRQATPFPWSTTRHDLILEYQNTRRNFRTFSTPYQSRPSGTKKSLRTKDGNQIPFGYCMAFHTRNTRCETENCSFQHGCPRCQAKHPVYRPCNTTPRPKTKDDNSEKNRRQ